MKYKFPNTFPVLKLKSSVKGVFAITDEVQCSPLSSKAFSIDRAYSFP
jgi:hypothetical protein